VPHHLYKKNLFCRFRRCTIWVIGISLSHKFCARSIHCQYLCHLSCLPVLSHCQLELPFHCPPSTLLDSPHPRLLRLQFAIEMSAIESCLTITDSDSNSGSINLGIARYHHLSAFDWTFTMMPGTSWAASTHNPTPSSLRAGARLAASLLTHPFSSQYFYL
jgi:hypothetical protein